VRGRDDKGRGREKGEGDREPPLAGSMTVSGGSQLRGSNGDKLANLSKEKKTKKTTGKAGTGDEKKHGSDCRGGGGCPKGRWGGGGMCKWATKVRRKKGQNRPRRDGEKEIGSIKQHDRWGWVTAFCQLLEAAARVGGSLGT